MPLIYRAVQAHVRYHTYSGDDIPSGCWCSTTFRTWGYMGHLPIFWWRGCHSQLVTYNECLILFNSVTSRRVMLSFMVLRDEKAMPAGSVWREKKVQRSHGKTRRNMNFKAGFPDCKPSAEIMQNQLPPGWLSPPAKAWSQPSVKPFFVAASAFNVAFPFFSNARLSPLLVLLKNMFAGLCSHAWPDFCVLACLLSCCWFWALNMPSGSLW